MLVPKPSEAFKHAADTVVGVMIEGIYEWHEYCQTCATATLSHYGERPHRTISQAEVNGSWRPYRCQRCKGIIRTTRVAAHAPVTTLKAIEP